MDRKLSPLPLLDEESFLADALSVGAKEAHVHKVWRYVVQHGTTNIASIPDIPKALIHLVAVKYAVCTSSVVSTTHSADGSTTKLLVRLQDGHLVESVIMRYGCVQLSSYPDTLQREDGQFRSKQRATLCVSSQVC